MIRDATDEEILEWLNQEDHPFGHDHAERIKKELKGFWFQGNRWDSIYTERVAVGRPIRR